MNILMISPNSPPKSSAESIQVGRYLQELDKSHHITLVTTPVERGWVSEDKTLLLGYRYVDVHLLSLPLHHILIRILSSRYFKWLVFPDKDFWIQYKSSFILQNLSRNPDIIYSRSVPFSSAILALKLKQKLNIPWVMHLSDPVYDNPYRRKMGKENKLQQEEYRCFKESDYITVTTESIANFYINKYPQFQNKIKITPNVMPHMNINYNIDEVSKNKITMVYAGALYGERNLNIFLTVIKKIKFQYEELYLKLDIKIIGNMVEEIEQDIKDSGLLCFDVKGRIDYVELLKIQKKSDILISIEPDGNNPILKTFLPSKILDYVVLQKPILALTPEGSETWNLCNIHGFGWAVESNHVEKLYQLLIEILSGKKQSSMLRPNYELLNQYNVINVVRSLNGLFETSLLGQNDE